MKLLIADDHVLLTDGLKLLFEASHPETTIVTAVDLNEAIDLTSYDNEYDAIITDLRMPGMRKDALIKAMVDNTPNCPKILVSGYANFVDIQRIKRLGYNAFLPKSILGRRLLTAVNDIIVNVGADPFWFQDYTKHHRWSNSSVTVREHDVLNLLKKGMSNKEIAIEIDLSPDTVKGHVKTLLLKFNAKSRTEIVVRAIEDGLI